MDPVCLKLRSPLASIRVNLPLLSQPTSGFVCLRSAQGIVDVAIYNTIVVIIKSPGYLLNNILVSLSLIS